MTPFDFVFALVSVITSLALTHIIGGVVALIRARRAISLVHALWILIAFFVVVGNWGALWSGHEITDWKPLAVAQQLMSMTALFAFAALVLPDDIEQVDRGFHEREGRTYMLAHLAFASLVIIFALARLGSIGEVIVRLTPASVAFALGTFALLFRNRVVQIIVATLLAAIAAGYAWSNLHIAA